MLLLLLLSINENQVNNIYSRSVVCIELGSQVCLLPEESQKGKVLCVLCLVSGSSLSPTAKLTSLSNVFVYPTHPNTEIKPESLSHSAVVFNSGTCVFVSCFFFFFFSSFFLLFIPHSQLPFHIPPLIHHSIPFQSYYYTSLPSSTLPPLRSDILILIQNDNLQIPRNSQPVRPLQGPSPKDC